MRKNLQDVPQMTETPTKLTFYTCPFKGCEHIKSPNRELVRNHIIVAHLTVKSILDMADFCLVLQGKKIEVVMSTEVEKTTYKIDLRKNSNP